MESANCSGHYPLVVTTGILVLLSLATAGFFSLAGVVPSFTSPLYRFDRPARFTGVHWDGFVPRLGGGG